MLKSPREPAAEVAKSHTAAGNREYCLKFRGGTPGYLKVP